MGESAGGGAETREKVTFFVFFSFLHKEEVEEEYQPAPSVLIEINPLPSLRELRQLVRSQL